MKVQLWCAKRKITVLRYSSLQLFWFILLFIFELRYFYLRNLFTIFKCWTRYLLLILQYWRLTVSFILRYSWNWTVFALDGEPALLVLYWSLVFIFRRSLQHLYYQWRIVQWHTWINRRRSHIETHLLYLRRYQWCLEWIWTAIRFYLHVRLNIVRLCVEIMDLLLIGCFLYLLIWRPSRHLFGNRIIFSYIIVGILLLMHSWYDLTIEITVIWFLQFTLVNATSFGYLCLVRYW